MEIDYRLLFVFQIDVRIDYFKHGRSIPHQVGNVHLGYVTQWECHFGNRGGVHVVRQYFFQDRQASQQLKPTSLRLYDCNLYVAESTWNKNII